MNQPVSQPWLEQLVSIGASLDALKSKIAVLRPESLQFMDRSDLCVVSFRGSDAAAFLQSQTCNDHALVTANHAQLNGYCSPKGRLLALPTVASDATAEVFYWLLPKDVAQATVKRLTMFVLRSDVKVRVEDTWAIVGLGAKLGGQETLKNDAVTLSPWFGELSAPVMSSWETHDHFGLKANSADGETRTLLFGPQDVLINSLKACKNILESAGSRQPVWSSAASWVWGDIEAGVPSIVAATQDSFVPQMVNMAEVDGLSFTKGCYPGQEIVARMQYLGKLKRTMVRFSVDTELSLSSGDILAAGEDANAGVVVASAVGVNQSGHIQTCCLAVVKTSIDQSMFTFNETALTVQTLPY